MVAGNYATDIPTENQHANLARLAYYFDNRAPGDHQEFPVSGVHAKPLTERGWALDCGPGYRQGLRDLIISGAGRDALARARDARPGPDPQPAALRGGRAHIIGSRG